MENKLEQLLNSLIEKGWKPFGFIVQNAKNPPYSNRYYFFENCADGRTVRELVSKESGLWQFVCENDYWVHKDTYFVEKYTDHIAIHIYQCNDYRYWLLGSALTDEDKLEDFLLQNIKIDE